MTATDELRALLDERGVEYLIERDRICIIANEEYHSAYENFSGKLVVTNLTPQQAIDAMLGPRITGDTSDGYHTFNELYHHRALLFSVIVRDHSELAWKARKHHDGTMYDGMFIVGIETPEGQATYHYDVNPYWEMFECKGFETAPAWDGHTPDQAIARIATLGRGECELHECEGSFSAVNRPVWRCDCGAFMTQYTDATTYHKPRFCPNCGRRVRKVDE